MDNWFTVENIDSDTFVISDYKHWEEIHCYLVCGKTKAALIDTGLSVSNIKEIVKGLTALPVEALITHAHWDHIGGHRYFGNFAVHEAEKEWLCGHFLLPLNVVKKNLLHNPCDFPDSFSAEDYQLFSGMSKTILNDRDRIDLGGRSLEVVHTPGHSPGHCCFYEARRKYLFFGNLIYNGCLDAFYPTTNPTAFFHSVQKIRSYDVDCLFLGHHSLNVGTGLIDEIEAGFLR